LGARRLACARRMKSKMTRQSRLTVTAQNKGAKKAARDAYCLLNQLSPARHHEFSEGSFGWLGIKGWRERPRAVLAGGGARNYFPSSRPRFVRKKLDNLIASAVNGLLHVIVNHTVLLQCIDAAVICFNGTESQRHWVENFMEDQVVNFCAAVLDCVKGPAPYCCNPHSISGNYACMYMSFNIKWHINT